jgi:SAM-dependent methyltransferase
MSVLYDTIGNQYATLRKPDPRIAQQISDALGDAQTVLNVGAGAGSYEPEGKQITAVEPSQEMISQRKADGVHVVQASAEDLPFEDNQFDASMAVLTIHHWKNQAKGLSEMRRVTRGPIVILTFDPNHAGFWLLDYLPELAALDEGQMPMLAFYERVLGEVKIEPVLIPHDCEDGFLGAYWRRPEAYLDPRKRAAISSFWKIGDVSEKLAMLQADISSGKWAKNNADLLALDTLDLGYRLVTV